MAIFMSRDDHHYHYTHRTAKARVMWASDDYVLVRECQRLLFDGSCVPGYEAALVFSHDTHAPPDDVIDQMMEAAGSCIHREDLEVVTHTSEIFIKCIYCLHKLYEVVPCL